MIKFYFSDKYADDDASATVVTKAEHLGAVVRAFKMFLTLAGYAPESVDCVTYDDREEGFRIGEGNRNQMDLFDDGEESGV